MSFVLPLLASLFACGSSGSSDAGGNHDNHAMGDAGTFGTVPPPNTDPSDCSDAAKLVYVVSDQNALYSFAPNLLKFNKIGNLNCEIGSNGGSVNSMAVARSGIAYVNYDDGAIFKVNTTDASCEKTSFKAGQAGFTPNLGMGFSSDSPGSKAETLFVSDNAGQGLGTIDLTTMTLTSLGAYTSGEAGQNAELTGTGDARLFGFFATSPAALAEITKTSGATPSPTALPTVNASDGGYAFSFWGGDFWFYTAFPAPDSPDPTTSVTHYDTAKKTASVALSNIGFVIVGAGVSTCAPVTSPR